MSSILDRLAQLSPERRRLLQKLLEQEAVATEGTGEIRRRSAGARLPLSFAQQRLWFIDRLDPGTAAYNMPFPLRLRGTLEARVLRRALSEIVRRHEALRTVFADDGGEAVQGVRPAAPVPFPAVDLSGLPAAAREAELRRLAREEALRPFDLARGPLLRATLLRLDAADHAGLFTLHHVVSDGWSMGVLVRELSALYAAFAGGAPSPLPELPVQYGDYTLWQRERLAGEALDAQLAWWKERLAGAPPVLELPTDLPPRPVAGASARSLPFELSAATTAAVAELARREGATPFMVLLAAWQLLLGRYAGQDDVVVGTPVAGRTRVELEGLIGFFVNTLAMRTDLSGEPPFRALLGRVRDGAVGAFEHQDLPFERLVEEIAPERSLAHTPVFQVMFALQNMELGALSLGGLRMEPLAGVEEVSQFALGFSLGEHEGRIGGTLHFRTDLFEEATAAGMLEHFRALLEGALAAPDRRVSELSLLAPGERARLLERGRARARPAGRTVPRLLAEQAARAPGALAVEGADGALTWAELDARSSRVAHALRALGVRAETPVGLCLERGAALLVGVLGTWKAGGAYLPLDPAYPPARLAQLLRDAGAPVLLSQRGLADALPGVEARMLLLDADAERIARESAAAPEVEIAPEQLAYVVYTSGSTGTPKGVRVQHGTLARTLAASLDAFGFAPGDVVPCLASHAFDIWLFEAVLPLLAGGSVRVLTREQVLETRELVRGLADAAALHAVPALMRQVAAEAAAAGPAALPRLRQVFVGGDAVPPDLLDEVRAAFPAAAVHVLYGPTEGTIICAAHRAEAGDARRQWIGRALGSAALYVLDGALQPTPAGVPGELCVGDGGAARDYLGRPEATAAKWLPDPFSGEPGARLYRTGDRVRWTAGGELEFLGRIDQQAKIRGFRVEPGEVEAVLAARPGVRGAAVLVREDAPGDRRLVAYVVPAEDAPDPARDAPGAGLQAEHVVQWESLFAEAYGGGGPDDDPAFHVAGWNSSYTGEPIPAPEMREWADRAAERVAATAPRRVLEIGCGTGLLLFRVAPACEEYWATDFAPEAIGYLRRQLARPGRAIPGTRLLERAADDFAGIPAGRFDLVVVNSVVQYFPGVDYLLRVLEGATGALAPGGRVFLGDVRSLPLLEAFHASVELAQAPGELSADVFRERVRNRMAREKELLLDPELFRALPHRFPRVSRVEVRLKRGAHLNEMTRFRYDVTLHVDGAADAAPPAWRRWDGEQGTDGLRREMAAERPEVLAFAEVPNARVAAATAAVEALVGAGEADTVDTLRRAAAAGEAGGVDPEAFWRLGEELGYRVDVRWSPRGRPGSYDVLLARRDVDAARAALAEDAAAPQPWSTYASDPLREKRVQRLLPELRAALAARLPEYMVPADFVLLDELPLSPNGKLDRRRLPAPEADSAEAYAAPRTRTEAALAGIFAEVLRRGRVGIHGDFFALGGHSLLATRVMSRVREALGAELPLRALFEAPTVAGLAARVDAAPAAAAGGPGALPIRPAPRHRPPPLSFAQQRLWFVEQLEPGSAAYTMPTALRLRGTLRVPALRRALTETVRRHESLRTVFALADGEPVQRVEPPRPVPLGAMDLSGLPAAARERRMRRLAAEEFARPFDLARGPLLRARLVRLGEDDWVLLFAVHHAVSDGWSMQLLVGEVAALYAAFLRGDPSPLPELPIQYGDYAAWERSWLAGGTLDRLVAWWAARLRGAPALLELPTDRPRPARRGYRGAQRERVVPPELLGALNALARREGATLYMVVLAAFKLLLARLSGQDDVVVGTPIAGRTRRETEGLIGLFVNTLALRTDLSGEGGFRALLARLREGMLGAHEHQEIPFERLVEALEVERSLAHTPIFQVMFNFLNLDEERRELPGVSLEPLAASSEADSKYDFTLYVQERDGSLSLRLLYTAELFDAERIDEMLAQLHALLAQAAADPDRPLPAFSLATPHAAAVLPDPAAPLEAEWNGPVHALVSARARRSPERTALRDPREEWSYGELEARSGRLAAWLRSRGIGAEDVVAVHAHRSASLVWALLGVLRAGGAFLVLDPAHPPARLARQLRAARPRALLRVEAAGPLPDEVAAWASEAGVPTLALPGRAAAERAGFLAEFPAGAPDAEVGPEDAAYLAFTSGTTGEPRGIVGTHRPLPHFVAWQRDAFDLTERDRFALLSGLAHDPLLRDVFTPLSLGATLCIPDPDALGEPGYLARWMAAEAVTAVHLTPAMGRLLDGPGDAALPALRHAFWGGDKVRAADAAALRARAPAAESTVFYGATETPQAVAFFPVPPGAAGAEVLPVGRGIDGVQLLVLARGGGLAGIGEVGEICVRTPYLARGYLRDEAATRERFVASPFTGDPADRVYRTGDLGRFRPDGAVQVLGRADAQLRVRGFRVEPAEVEAALREHPRVRAAAVVLHAADGAAPRLAAYVAADGGAPAGEELRAHLRERVPEYMVPAVFVGMERLPLTPNGKLDRAALPAPEAPPGAVYVAPRTPVEEALAGIWADVLGTGRVGAADSFFALGGQSLLATRLVSRVREMLGVELPLRAVFEAPTVAELAARVEALRSAGGAADAAPIPRAPRGGDLPLSFAQQRLWFIHRMDPESAAYNLAYPLRLRGALDVRALARSLDDLVARHEALRTVFPAGHGEPVQRVLPPSPRRIPLVDLRRVRDDGREDAARRLAAEEARRPFDLAAGPLLRVLLARLADGEWVLCLTLHHVVGDGWSLGVLVREVNALYAAHTLGEPARLPELAVQYADYAVWQRERLGEGAMQAQLAWWRERLAGAPPVLELPADFPRRPAAAAPAGALPFRVSGETGAALRALCRREGATPFMALLAAWSLLLSRYAAQDDVVVGSPIAGRTRSELEPLIGFFVNTLALRTDLSGDPSFAALLARVREATLGAYQHQDVPFERLVEELKPARSLSHTPLFQVMFALQNAERGELRLGGLRAEPLAAADDEARFDLTLTLFEDGAGFHGALAYRTDLFAAATAERMLEHFGRVLDAAAAHPARPVSAIDLLGEPERERLARWSGTPSEYPRQSIHALFAAQAARTPDAVALSWEGGSLTYAELERRAGRLARRLLARGVRTEDRVGVFMERGPELVAALLGILQAGGAYVPLDPAYPAERLAYILADSGVPVLLAQEGLRERIPEFAGEVVMVDGVTPHPPAPSPTRGEGENDTSESEDRQRGDSPPPERGRVAALRPPGGGDPADAPQPPVDPENLAYVLYTSGSTGEPRGAEVPHRAVVRLVRGADYARLGPDEVFLQLAPTGFDAATFEIWGALLNGGRLVLPPPGASTVGQLADVVAREGVTTLWLTAGLFHLVVDEQPGALAGVRQLLAGGDVLSPAHVARALEALPGTRLVNGYGPTENTTFTCCHAVRADDARRGSIPIGRPIAGTRVHVLDGRMQPVPVGVPGELFAGGAGLARGYRGRPGPTAEKWVPDPFSAEPGARLYRTGDRARWLPGGTLEFLGRTDQQVKVRGFRVEPGETEAALRAHPAVRDAVVLARADLPGDVRLVGYAVPAGAEPVDGAGLRRWLALRLPEHMVPSAVVVLDSLPLTANGKLDRRALPAPAAAGGEGYVPPRDPTEEILAGIWAELLHLERVGIHDDFFALGGHSLLATRTAARVRETFGVDLPLRAYFEAPTVAALAERLAAEQPAVRLEDWELEEELARIEELSDEELRRLLGE